jgi:hypothetical protein
MAKAGELFRETLPDARKLVHRWRDRQRRALSVRESLNV